MIQPRVRVVAIAIFVFFMLAAAQAMGQITVIPSDPSPGEPFQIKVRGVVGHSPATLSDPIMEIQGSTIHLQISVEMGPWTQLSEYTYIFDIPAMAPGTYTVEFWEVLLDDPVPAPNLMDTLILQLYQNPVPILSASGLLLLTLLIVTVGVLKLSR